MKSLKKLIRENLNDKLCQIIRGQLDRIYHYQGEGRTPRFHREGIANEDGHNYSYPVVYIIATKTYYYAVINDMIKQIENVIGVNKEESYECIKNYVDEKVNETHIMIFSDGEDIIDSDDYDAEYDDEYLEEAEEESSGGESSGGGESKSSTSATGKEWESGITRGPANPITYDSEWAGQRGWEGIKSFNVTRGKSNPL
jgi:hypothetical protein